MLQGKKLNGYRLSFLDCVESRGEYSAFSGEIGKLELVECQESFCAVDTLHYRNAGVVPQNELEANLLLLYE